METEVGGEGEGGGGGGVATKDQGFKTTTSQVEPDGVSTFLPLCLRYSYEREEVCVCV